MYTWYVDYIDIDNSVIDIDINSHCLHVGWGEISGYLCLNIVFFHQVHNQREGQIASSVLKGCKSGFVTYRNHVVKQAKLQLVVKCCFWLVMSYPIKIYS